MSSGGIWYNVLMKKILLSNGSEAIVDDEDFDKVTELAPWSFCVGYASRYTPGSAKTRKRFYMHHFIMGVKPDMFIIIDHINRNRLDNRKNNLRLVTRSINGRNANNPGNHKGNTSGYLGVGFYPRHRNPAKQWRAMYAGKTLGYFPSPEEASEAYKAYVNMIE